MASWTYQSFDGPYQRRNGWWVVYLTFQEAKGEQRSVTLKFPTRPTVADVTAKRPQIKAMLDDDFTTPPFPEIARALKSIITGDGSKAERFDAIVAYLQSIREG